MPIDKPSDVFKFRIVGLLVVLQHTPREVTVAPPSEITLPPEVAVYCVASKTVDVVTEGNVGWALIRTLAEEPDVPPDALVTWNV